MSVNAVAEDGWVDRWPRDGSAGRPGLAQRLQSQSKEGELLVITRHQGYLNAAARIALFGKQREGFIRWTTNEDTHQWGIRAVDPDEGYRVDRKGRMNVRALTDELDPGAWPVRFLLVADPLNPSRLVFAGVGRK